MGRLWQAGGRCEPHAEQEAEYRGRGDAESGRTPTFTHDQAQQGTDKVWRSTATHNNGIF